MRIRFKQQLELGIIPIGEVEIDTQSRHQLPPALLALQYIFKTPELNEQVFKLLESKIKPQKMGRNGMSLWEILVLAVVRLNLNIDYDHLLDNANEHRSIRSILGVGRSDFRPHEKKYKLQTVKDNVSLLDDELLQQINTLVVKAGHKLVKKKRKNRVK